MTQRGSRRRVDGVVFDMDGVLVDSEPLWHEAEIEVLVPLGVPLTRELCLQTTGVRVDGVVRLWRERHPWGDVPDDATVTDAIVDGVVRRVRSRAEPMPGAHAALLAAGELPLGLASSSPRRIIDAVLDRLGIRPRFAVVQSAEALPRGKPDPLVYLLACQALGVDPRHAVAVEDSSSGLRAAAAAGMIVVAVPDPAAHVPDALDVADVVLDSLLAFPRWLAEQPRTEPAR
jgi:HAD superfamily hydrolase (TIGR01509 family)